MALVYKGKITRIINETGGVPTLVRFRLAYFSDAGAGSWGIVGDAGGDDPDPTPPATTITLTKGTAVDATNFPDYYYYSGHCVLTGAYTLDIDGTEQEGDIGVPLLGMNIGNGAAGSISVINATETLTNKRLTNPKFNEAVNMTATSTDLNYAKDLRATGVTVAELGKLDGFTGVAADLNYAKDLKATGVSVAEIDVLDGVDTTSKVMSIGKALSSADTAPVVNDKVLDYFDGYLDVSTGDNDVDVTIPVCDTTHIGTEFCIYHRVQGNILEIKLAGDGAGNRFLFMTGSDEEVEWRTITSTTAGDCVIVKMLSPKYYLVLGGKGALGA